MDHILAIVVGQVSNFGGSGLWRLYLEDICPIFVVVAVVGGHLHNFPPRGGGCVCGCV